jgi:hypothetical protein
MDDQTAELLTLAARKGYRLQPVLYKPGWYIYEPVRGTYVQNSAADQPLFTERETQAYLVEQEDVGDAHPEAFP